MVRTAPEASPFSLVTTFLSCVVVETKKKYFRENTNTVFTNAFLWGKTIFEGFHENIPLANFLYDMKIFSYSTVKLLLLLKLFFRVKPSLHFFSLNNE
jgi:hypothetical protein